MVPHLKPCPFCGCDKILDGYIRDGREIVCGECRASVAAFHPDASERAAERWNHRAEAALSAAEPDGWICEDEFTLEREQADEWGDEGSLPKPFYFAPQQSAQVQDVAGLLEVVEAMARFDGRNNNAHLKQMAKDALASYRAAPAKQEG